MVGGLSLVVTTKGDLPSPERYFTIYAVYGLIITLILTLNRQAYHRAMSKTASRESLLSSVFQSINNPLMILDQQLNIRQLNAAAKSLEDRIQQAYQVDLLDIDVYDLETLSYRPLKELVDVEASEIRTAKISITIHRQLHWYSLTTSPHRLGNQVKGVVVSISDVTEQHQLMQTQKINAVGILANGIAHDFNNMLGAINSSTELLFLDLEEEHHDLLNIISEASERSANLIKQLQLFSKQRSNQTTTVDLHQLIHDVSLVLESFTQHAHTVELNLCDEALLISGERELLQSMLMNLGMNAIQAMEGRGKLWFKTSVGVFADDEGRGIPMISIEVSDEGVGITPEVQVRIFEPFFTTRDIGEGVGLGLTAVHSAVKRHHGRIEVESLVGQGSTFRILLPLDRSLHLPAPTPPPVNLDTDLSNKRILIIDDEPLVLKSLQTMLEAIDLYVETVESGDEGMARLRTSDDFDFIILDMLMPYKNGHEVFMELQQDFAHIPVILSSGFYPENSVRDMEANGLAGKLHKPYGLEEVKQVITRVLERQSLQDTDHATPDEESV